jgi:hypothetical protein
MANTEIPKPVAIAVATLIGLFLIVTVWLKSGAAAAPRVEPAERMSEDQKRSQEAVDFQRHRREEGPPKD